MPGRLGELLVRENLISLQQLQQAQEEQRKSGGRLGYIYLPALVIISIASMAMAPLGARTAHRMDIRPLKKVFATVLYGLAAYFLLR